MPIVRKAQSINNVAKKKDPAKVSVQSVREPALIKEMNDTSFGTLDASKDGFWVNLIKAQAASQSKEKGKGR